MGQACCAERDHFQNLEYLAAKPIRNHNIPFLPLAIVVIDPLITAKIDRVHPFQTTNLNPLTRGVFRDTQHLSTINCYYKGEWKEGRLHGVGTMLFPDGSIYTGMFQNNEANGEGKYLYPNGSYYEGEIRNNLANGYGKYFDSS